MSFTALNKDSLNKLETFIALVDCNSFFCSCERLFDPSIRHKPVVVLSNNDGCVVSLTREAKQIGIPMGVPVFKVKHLIDQHQVAVRSSNFSLYGNLSQRVMLKLKDFSPDIEIYSIDEAFLKIQARSQEELIRKAIHIRDETYKDIGIPVSVGIARTKVLAKAANLLGKRQVDKTSRGVRVLIDSKDIRETLLKFPIQDLWGIGRKSALKLNTKGIQNAWELRESQPELIRKFLTIHGLKLQEELKEKSCISLKNKEEPQKQILCSRSFERLQTEKEALLLAISEHVANACANLRSQNLYAKGIQVFIQTHPHKDEEQYYKSASFSLLVASQETSVFLKEAQKLLLEIYAEGYRFKKSGIILCDFYPESEIQYSLFETSSQELVSEKSPMKVLDEINERFGHSTLRLGAQSLKTSTENSWRSKSEKKSKRFTTELSEIMKVR